jgi:hypothetical protein
MTARPASSARDQPVDIRLGADIDASGRVFGDQQLAAGCQPAADDDLLLVAARQCLDRQMSGSLGRRPTVSPILRALSASLRGDKKRQQPSPDGAGIEEGVFADRERQRTDSSVRSRAIKPTPVFIAASGAEERSGASPWMVNRRKKPRYRTGRGRSVPAPRRAIRPVREARPRGHRMISGVVPLHCRPRTLTTGAPAVVPARKNSSAAGGRRSSRSVRAWSRQPASGRPACRHAAPRRDRQRGRSRRAGAIRRSCRRHVP